MIKAGSVWEKSGCGWLKSPLGEIVIVEWVKGNAIQYRYIHEGGKNGRGSSGDGRLNPLREILL